MYRNLGTPTHLDSTENVHKDTVISALKKELFELKDLEHDFLRLNDEVANIESKYSLLLDEKEKAENEHKIKIDINKKNVSELKVEIDTLKANIHRVNVQIDDTLRENATLKRMCENREAEITSLMASNKQVERSNETQEEENKTLTITLRQLKEERMRNEQECERLNKLLDESISSLKQLEKEARQLESSNAKLDNVLVQAEKDHACLVDELKSREEQLSLTNKKLQDLNAENIELAERTAKLEKECDKSQGEYHELTTGLEGIVTKNRQLATKLKGLENLLRSTESELEQSIVKRQSLKKEHLDLAGDNKSLNDEIDSCLLSILEYEKVNKELQREVQNYIECDEEARAMLNRREAMRNLLEQVTSKLMKTEEQIAHLR